MGREHREKGDGQLQIMVLAVQPCPSHQKTPVPRTPRACRDRVAAAAAGCVGRQPIERHLMRSATPRVEVCFVRIAADRATFYTHGIHERAHGSIVAATA